MTRLHTRLESQASRIAGLFALALPAALGGCTGDDGDQGPPGPPGPSGPTPTDLTKGDDLPGIDLQILNISGGTGSNGHVLPGNTVSVHFTVKKGDGTTWDLSEFSSGRTLISGPTFNYQRVIAEQSDVITRAVQQADESYVYTYAMPIPTTYLAPLNDTAAFGVEDGEMTGQALLNGTYTVGLYFRWSYTVDGASERTADNATFDFVIGNGGTIDTREVVTQDNCNRCHEDLAAHGGMRKDVTICLMCHTAGSEDRNTAAGGTPGVSIDFKVMIHKIHAGEHLPSVQGVSTDTNGMRLYGASQPYQIVGNNDSIHDYSGVAFPAWPHGLVAMPRDEGYTALSASAKTAEDVIRTGPSNCVVCHGDPDGSGPLIAPAQGAIHQTQPTRQACGSCHDDINWGHAYTANSQTMPSQANNSNCTLCHETAGNSLAVYEAHLHPLLDSAFDGGVNVDVTDLVEAGTNDGDGTIDAGEKIAITFTLTDDSGADILPSAVGNFSTVLSGPTSNYNLVLNTSLPTAAMTGAQPYTLNLPMAVLLEPVGTSTAANGDMFTTDFAPIWNVSGAATTVYTRTATAGGNSVLSSASVAPQNYVDVANAAGFLRDQYVVVDDGVGGLEEYVRVQYVDGLRLWFGASGGTSYPPGLQKAHAAGATVKGVTLATEASGDYSVNTANGVITEVNEFGAGLPVIVSYSTDFVMPSTYPLTINDSPDIGETFGEWVGKPVADGTYSLGIWTSRTLMLNLYGEANSYRSASDSANFDFLVGSATTSEPYALISSAQNCYNCHQELTFHGAGRRSYDSCVLCHSASGTEDRPPYVAGAAPPTTGLTIKFSTMLHKIHMGEELANAANYAVVGFGSGSYPNNFGVSHFDEVVFPALPDGVSDCAKCHGSSNTAWHEPSMRAHPTAQGEPVLHWAVVCGACHDSPDAQAHIEVQTSPTGAESCGVCHGEGGEWDVERMHKVY
jgi:OmcA/MtrC family decaheme c-type cytochrome